MKILDMSKLESDEIVLEAIPFDLGSISEEVLVVIGTDGGNGTFRSCGKQKRSHTGT